MNGVDSNACCASSRSRWTSSESGLNGRRPRAPSMASENFLWAMSCFTRAIPRSTFASCSSAESAGSICAPPSAGSGASPAGARVEKLDLVEGLGGGLDVVLVEKGNDSQIEPGLPVVRAVRKRGAELRDGVVGLAYLAQTNPHVGPGVDILRCDIEDAPVESDGLIVLAGVVIHVGQPGQGLDVLGILLDRGLERVQLLDDAGHHLL